MYRSSCQPFALGLLLLPAARGGAQGEPGPGDLSVSFRLYPASAQVTEREPVVALVTMRNLSGKPLHVRLGSDTWPALEVAVYDRARKRLSPSFKTSEGGLSALMSLLAGEERVFPVLVDRYFRFPNAGEYTVEAILWGCGPSQRGVLATARQEYHVSPLSVERLTQVCEALTSRVDVSLRGKHDVSYVLPAWQNKNVERELDNMALPMLAFVSHEVALPYLVTLAQNFRHPVAFAGIRRVGTDRARKVLEQFSESPDTVVSRLAKKELDIWDHGEPPHFPPWG